MFWSAKLKGWCFNDGDNPACEMLPEEMRTFMVRIDGRCLTPAEVDARIATARKDALKEAADLCDQLDEHGGGICAIAIREMVDQEKTND